MVVSNPDADANVDATNPMKITMICDKDHSQFILKRLASVHTGIGMENNRSSDGNVTHHL